MSGSTRTVRLSAAQAEYLLQATFLPPRLREVVTAASLGGDSSGLEVSGNIADEFQSVFTERLAKVGFDADYDLTDEGATLEELIDLFGSESP
jgi:hypothetical protein